MSNYDCTEDVNEHIGRVRYWISWFQDILTYRSEHHDESKLQEPEKSMFDEYTPKLQQAEFGSDEYKKQLEGMGEALKHHYKHNAHHPEHYGKGIEGMALFDLVEMVSDWMAAASKKGSSIDLKYFKDRFGISDQLLKIIENTLWCADMDNVNNRIPFEFAQKHNFLKHVWSDEHDEYRLSPDPYEGQ